ncbi:hypothetical protein N0V82_003199 [Gnomoniopsis sp. IMI 355080]|nr:hypothetical protein N0V82_003199 [Gnomoniopsis sp. IMI 355080]
MASLHWGLYLILAAINVVAFIFVRYCLVETRGKTLEEMAHLFGIEEKRSDGENEHFSEQRGLLSGEPLDDVDNDT